jgi:hypothetical protein
MSENKLIVNKHIFVCINYDDITNKQYNEIKNNFCGLVITNINELENIDNIDNIDSSKTLVYLCGNINVLNLGLEHIPFANINIIKELSTNYDNTKYNLINIGEVPINIHNVGVLFKHFYNTDKDYFNSLCEEHKFQSLTESNKNGSSYRKGIYLTKVEEVNDEIKFNLLRCSTNLDGPTDNFRNTDNEIIEKVNNISKYFFEQKANLNHVLAQIYENTKKGGVNQNKEVKATIKAHSDKTKDMSRNALMAFCTFYKNYQNQSFSSEELTKFKKSQEDQFDYVYKSTSVLTHLRFRLKKMIEDETLSKQFDVILYPNSVFLMSLNTNRLYTHEIIPSVLPVDIIPTRLGYVVRCSTTKASFKDNQTFVINNNKYFKLEQPSKDDITELRHKYYLENLTDEFVEYDDIYYSMNNGDYTKPNL